MICPECRAKVPDQYSFCPRCGHQVKELQPEVAERLSEYDSKRAAKKKQQAQPPRQQNAAPNNAAPRASAPAVQPEAPKAVPDPKLGQALDQALDHPVEVIPAQQPAAPEPEIIPIQEAAPAEPVKPAEKPAQKNDSQNRPKNDPRNQEPRWKQREREAAEAAAAGQPAKSAPQENAQKNNQQSRPKNDPRNQEPRWKQREREAAEAASAGQPAKSAPQENAQKNNQQSGQQGKKGDKKYPKNQEPRWKKREREAAEAAAAAAGGLTAAAAAENAAPAPIPEPVPAPKPAPAPEPVPAPKPAPAPEPVPAPEPAPAPKPAPAPEPAPAPKPAPTPKPAPAPEPAPAPKPAPAPAPKPKPVPKSAIPDPVPAKVLPSEQTRKVKGIPALCVLLAANLACCGFLGYKYLSKDDKPETASSSTAEVSSESSDEPAETTTELTTTTAEQTTTTRETTTQTEATTAEETTTTKETTTKEPEPDPGSAAAYYADHPGVAFGDNANDPLCPPGLYTRLSNDDGGAMQEEAAKNALQHLPIRWNVLAYPVYENVPDGNGTSDSAFRYVTDAYPVPLLGLSLPASVDLCIHNGSEGHGHYLRTIDYFFGNHSDDRSGYTWKKDELYKVYTELNGKLRQRFGNGAAVAGASYEGVRYNTPSGGSVDIFFYNNGNDTYMMRLIRSNN